ncbi:unnamed protein product [Rhizophagus irregularis]|nr:unnamed protein product [Rhizophagus irregularis]
MQESRQMVFQALLSDEEIVAQTYSTRRPASDDDLQDRPNKIRATDITSNDKNTSSSPSMDLDKNTASHALSSEPEFTPVSPKLLKLLKQTCNIIKLVLCDIREPEVSSNIKEFEESGRESERSDTEEFESSSIEEFEGSNTKESKGISNKLKY